MEYSREYEHFTNGWGSIQQTHFTMETSVERPTCEVSCQDSSGSGTTVVNKVHVGDGLG